MIAPFCLWCNFFKIVLYQLFVVLVKVRLGVLFMKDVNPCILCLSDAYLLIMNHQFFAEVAVKIKIFKWVFLIFFCSFISIDVKFRSYYNRYQFTSIILIFWAVIKLTELQAIGLLSAAHLALVWCLSFGYESWSKIRLRFPSGFQISVFFALVGLKIKAVNWILLSVSWFV